jgi:hypothetical protein
MHWRATVLLACTALSLVASLVAPAVASAQPAPFCPPGQPARFVLGIGELKERLGLIMGEPVECEHIDPANRDTLQRTSTGLAYYRLAINTPIFTNGTAHYALAEGQLLFWENASVEPPRPTTAESAYLTATASVLGRADALTARLATMREIGGRGRLGSISFEDMGEVLDGLAAARDAFASTQESARLKPYDDAILESLAAAAASAEALLQARLTDLPAARAAFLSDAEAHAADSERLRGEATMAYSRALPIIVR